jgi:hypothetical protein
MSKQYLYASSNPFSKTENLSVAPSWGEACVRLDEPWKWRDPTSQLVSPHHQATRAFISPNTEARGWNHNTSEAEACSGLYIKPGCGIRMEICSYGAREGRSLTARGNFHSHVHIQYKSNGIYIPPQLHVSSCAAGLVFCSCNMRFAVNRVHHALRVFLMYLCPFAGSTPHFTWIASSV